MQGTVVDGLSGIFDIQGIQTFSGIDILLGAIIINKVVASPAVDNVCTALAIKRVAATAGNDCFRAGSARYGNARAANVLDIFHIGEVGGAQIDADAVGLDGINAFSGFFNNAVADIINVIKVIAVAAGHHVRTGAAVQNIRAIPAHEIVGRRVAKKGSAGVQIACGRKGGRALQLDNFNIGKLKYACVTANCVIFVKVNIDGRADSVIPRVCCNNIAHVAKQTCGRNRICADAVHIKNIIMAAANHRV